FLKNDSTYNSMQSFRPVKYLVPLTNVKYHVHAIKTRFHKRSPYNHALNGPFQSYFPILLDFAYAAWLKNLFDLSQKTLQLPLFQFFANHEFLLQTFQWMSRLTIALRYRPHDDLVVMSVLKPELE